MPTLQVRTLRQFLESDQVIDCDCSNYWECAHTGPLRIEMAIQRLGWEFDFYAGREALAERVLVYTDDTDHTMGRVDALAEPPASVLVRRSTLEDVYLMITGRTLDE